MSEYYQIVCPKPGCSVYYSNDELHTTFPPGATKTWRSAHPDHQSAYILSSGKSPDEVCPAHLQEEWKTLNTKMKAYTSAYIKASMDVGERCVVDLIPERDLERYLQLKTEITEHVFQNFSPDKNLRFLTDLNLLLTRIAKQKLSVNPDRLRAEVHEYKTREFWKRVTASKPYVVFDMFRTRTGRLATCRGSFPILTMAKSYRKIIDPVNDYFVELDYNAAELRTLLALSGVEQPEEDLHEWNIQNVFRGTETREEAKKRVFAWLYNPEAKDRLLDRTYDRKSVVKKYFTGEEVTTFFDRTIPCDSHRALNYIIQSTTSDMFLRQVLEVADFMREKMKKSFISFMMHDSVLLDVSKDELHLVRKAMQVFRETPLGSFKVNMKIGTNYGNLEEIKR